MRREENMKKIKKKCQASTWARSKDKTLNYSFTLKFSDILWCYRVIEAFGNIFHFRLVSTVWLWLSFTKCAVWTLGTWGGTSSCLTSKIECDKNVDYEFWIMMSIINFKCPCNLRSYFFHWQTPRMSLIKISCCSVIIDQKTSNALYAGNFFVFSPKTLILLQVGFIKLNHIHISKVTQQSKKTKW